MRIIGILLVLLVIAYLINTQLGSGQTSERARVEQMNADPQAPVVPTDARDVEQFGEDMQEYLDEQARKRAEAIREAEGG